LLDPKAVGRMPNGDSLRAGTDRISRDAFSFGRSHRITGIGVLVGTKDLAGDFGSTSTCSCWKTTTRSSSPARAAAYVPTPCARRSSIIRSPEPCGGSCGCASTKSSRGPFLPTSDSGAEPGLSDFGSGRIPSSRKCPLQGIATRPVLSEMTRRD
jgi:hypothetical protein